MYSLLYCVCVFLVAESTTPVSVAVKDQRPLSFEDHPPATAQLRIYNLQFITFEHFVHAPQHSHVLIDHILQ